MGFKPEDVMSDDASHVEKNGVVIRKGSMAAVMANIEVIEDDSASPAEKQSAKEAIKELAPTLIGVGMTEYVTWKNPEVQAIFDEAEI